MAQNPAKFRYVHYISTRILLAEELVTQQQIDRLVDSTNVPMAYELNALYRDGALLNTGISITGTTVTLSAIDNTKPMLVFCRGIWEPFTTTPIALGASTKIYLNYVVISQAQVSGDAEMAELQLSLGLTSTAGAPNSSANELERNPVDITILTFTNAAGVATLVPADNTYPEARGSKGTSGLVALTTATSAGTALSSDDVAVTNQRIPTPGSVNTSKVAAVITAGTNTDGSAKVDPAATGQGGVQADHLIYVAGTQTIEAALTSIGSSVAGVVSSLSNHINKPLGPGVHPMPNYVDVGAAPISHVGATLDHAHQPTLTNDHTGFIVTRNPAVPYSFGDSAYLIRNLDGSVLASIEHDGNYVTPGNPYYQQLSQAYLALFSHVSQVSHANPHGLTLGDLGGVSVGQEQTDIANILAAAENYTNSKLPVGTSSSIKFGNGYIFQFGRGAGLSGSQNGQVFTAPFGENFPGTCLFAAVFAFASGGDFGETPVFATMGWNNAGVQYYYQRNADHGGMTVSPLYIAIGY